MKLRVVVSNCPNPYLNIAVEGYLVSLEETDTVTLYLWRNRRTVVIGQNQNPYAECHVAQLEADGGYLMRRKTGGGAVYHDMGNLNFSFVASPLLYDQTKQFSVLQQAVSQYGLHTEVSGRNDVLCEGRKFSGNAFSKNKYQFLHHGTILIKTDVEELQRYLMVKPFKLQKHGVKSVQSRVVNLSEIAPIIAEDMIPAMINAFESVYGQKADVLSFEELTNNPHVKSLYDEFSSPEWKYGRWKEFKVRYAHQYVWGDVEVALNVDEEHSVIKDVEIATDALDVDAIELAKSLLKDASTLYAPIDYRNSEGVVSDIIRLVYE